MPVEVVNLNEEVKTKEIEEEPKEQIEEAKEQIEEAPIKEVIETKKEEAPKEELKNNSKTERLDSKTITCPKCNKTMLLRSYRYKHEKNCSGNLEDKPIKQIKPKSKPNVKVAPQPPLQTVEEPQAVKQSIYQESNSIKPLSVLDDYFKKIQMQKQQQADQIFNKMINSNSKTRARKR